MSGSTTNIQVTGVQIDTKLLDKIGADADGKAHDIVNKYGNMMVAAATQHPPIPIDTGALRNSVLAESKMTDNLTFTISDGVDYGIYQELGTSKMAAQPFIIPSIELYKDRFMDAFKELFA